MALTKDRNTPMRDGEQMAVPLGAEEKIYAGAIVMALPSGFAACGFTGTNMTYLGRAENAADNTGGSDGDVHVNVRRGKAFKFKNSNSDAVNQSSLGKHCYVQDDETVAATNGSNTRSQCGIVIGIDPDGVWVAN